MRLKVFLMCLLLTGCNVPTMSDAKTTVKKYLKDPDSARFGELRVVKVKNGREVVCGEVNAKNSLGGYAGNTGFIYDPDHDDLFLEKSDIWQPTKWVDSLAVESVCRSKP
jgi:hypothetical protein